jgi:hypothetical protein
MIALGVVLAILGFFFSHVLLVIGVILVIVGVIFHVLGTVGRPVGGRRYWY